VVSAAEPSDWRHRAAVRWLLRAVQRIVWFAFRAGLVGWASLAVYYRLERTWLALALASVLASFGIWTLWYARRRSMYRIFALAFAVVAAWWWTIRPSNDRAWRPEVAVTPRAIVDGDRVLFTGVRDFAYRSADDFTVRYEEREVRFSEVVAVDFFISFWMPGPLGHTFLSFVFDEAPPLTVSIETRGEVGEAFDPVASLFKEFELVYVVGSERDVIGVRTNHRDEDVFMYRIRGTPERARRLFEVYVERINELADEPEFYHLLKNSCTVNIIRYARRLGPIDRFDPRFYLNGMVDRFLYAVGGLDTALPFRETRARARITALARAAGDAEDFSVLIRASQSSTERMHQ
jgi:hypothetical protein